MNNDAQQQIVDDLLLFLSESPTTYHAVASMQKRLLIAGFTQLHEGDAWHLVDGQGYFVTRNASAIIAFRYLPKQMEAKGLAVLGAHTDSPCLKVKPNPEKKTQGYFQLGVETYGGVLLNPWFDRDLSLAGRVNYRNKEGKITAALFDKGEAIASIPSLAIHLNREANNQNKINPQQHILPILSQVNGMQPVNFRQWLQAQLIEKGIDDCEKVLDYDLSFYDTQAPAQLGLYPT